MYGGWPKQSAGLWRLVVLQQDQFFQAGALLGLELAWYPGFCTPEGIFILAAAFGMSKPKISGLALWPPYHVSGLIGRLTHCMLGAEGDEQAEGAFLFQPACKASFLSMQDSRSPYQRKSYLSM